MGNTHRAMSPEDRKIYELLQELDEEQLKATLATVEAMATWLGNVAAVAVGNVVLAMEGYAPTHMYASEDK